MLQKYNDNRLHPPPEAFLYLDERNYLQDHIKRKIEITTILYEKNVDGRTADTRWRCNMALSQKEEEDKHRKNIKKYWWIPNP